ncbi:MAG: hydrogenase maturation protein [Betaproteobacteria bacterium]|nr:hydrogenase maturation protein [Betaproteobacteria bacterium]
MRILFLTHAFNSLTQRLYVELTALGHEVSIEFDIDDRVTAEAVALWRPELVVAPFLKRRIPEPIWRAQRCIVIHPGIEGDRGPSALDWAIADGETEWGVTALEANAEMDAGDVWASVGFAMRDAAKGSLYRNEVTEAAVTAIGLVLERLVQPGFRPRPLEPARPGVRGRLRPPMRQPDRAIDWSRDGTAAVLRKIRAADGFPGVHDAIHGLPVALFDAHPEDALRRRHASAAPGTVLATRDGAVCRATVDGAVWITHLRRIDGQEPSFKLPAATVLGERLAGVPEAPLAPDAVVDGATWRPIRYEEQGAVGYVHFPFYNGAMGTRHCEQLRAAVARAKARPTRVIVLLGGPDFWSNGIHLNLIEAAAQPADESWRNIEAMNDLVREILLTERQMTVAALQGNAGAGGVFLALAADRVYARDGVILNPHYKAMGNLYGSEYWTYLLPRRVGPARAQAITGNRLPLGAGEAARVGLVDGHFGATPAAFCAEIARRAAVWAAAPGLAAELAAKRARRAADEAQAPLAGYRAAEMERMRLNFYGFDASYHVARHHFVHKLPRSRTPLHLARHRRPAGGAPTPRS